MKIILGLILIGAGILVAIFGPRPLNGDRSLPKRYPDWLEQGWLEKLLDPEQWNNIGAYLASWAVGLLLIGFGLTSIFGK